MYKYRGGTNDYTNIIKTRIRIIAQFVSNFREKDRNLDASTIMDAFNNLCGDGVSIRGLGIHQIRNRIYQLNNACAYQYDPYFLLI